MITRSHGTDPTAAAQRILAMSHAAEVCAVNAEWEEVSRIHARRRALIDAYFSDKGPGPDTCDAPTLREVLATDQRVMHLASEARRRFSDQARTMTRGRRAVREYAASSPR